MSALDDNFDVGIQEKVIKINNKGQALGFSVSELGSQVRAAINGEEITNFLEKMRRFSKNKANRK